MPPKLVYKDLAATPPTIPSGVELTAPATTVIVRSASRRDGSDVGDTWTPRSLDLV